MVKERPILFSGPMVSAILEGRKSVTRRVVKPQPMGALIWDGGWRDDLWYERDGADVEAAGLIRCPYGQPGDQLWVREGWRPVHRCMCGGVDGCDCGDWIVTYQADRTQRLVSEVSIPDEWNAPKASRTGYVTPLHMPRWASRLTLEVTEVRVQRLQEISEEDAKAEGIEPMAGLVPGPGPQWWRDYRGGVAHPSARCSFHSLWDSINGKRPGCSWDANPFVWAVSFRRVTHE